MHQGVDFLVYWEQVSEQIHKKNFLVTNRPGPQCINHMGVLTHWCILHQQLFCKLIYIG
jgi:hypothetical protein